MYYDLGQDYWYEGEGGSGYNSDEGFAEYGDTTWAAESCRNTVQCVNGPTCKFKALGVCRFYHPEVEEEAGEEAWEDTLPEEWQAWEESEQQEYSRRRSTQVARDASQPQKASSAVDPLESLPANAVSKTSAGQPSHRWNVLVNSQPTPAKSSAATAAPVDATANGSRTEDSGNRNRLASRSGSRTPRRRQARTDSVQDPNIQPVPKASTADEQRPPKSVVRLTEAPRFASRLHREERSLGALEPPPGVF